MEKQPQPPQNPNTSGPNPKRPQGERPPGDSQGPRPTGQGPTGEGRRPVPYNLLLLGLVTLLVVVYFFSRPSLVSVPYSYFLNQVKGIDKSGKEGKTNVTEVVIRGNEIIGRFREKPIAPAQLKKDGEWEVPQDKNGKDKRLDLEFQSYLPEWFGDKEREELSKLLTAKETEGLHWRSEPPVDNSLSVMLMLFGLPLLLFFLMWSMFRRTRDQMMGGGFLSGFSKSPAKRYENSQRPTTFQDVAGLEGVKADLQEIVEFLKSPDKFRRLGGFIPKGVLLCGPPGTGKTLLARAVAGEAGVPFFSVSGSEFIQMFVGVGASRVRDLFATAKAAAPCILFIDEIDAVGRQRGAGLGGGHDEREQTLNQILSEMDGFTPTETVIVLAATNRPDVLDPALLRPGRFDRHVTVDRPTLKGREAILGVHVRNVPLADDVNLKRVAAGTVGLTGADLRNIVNEAALWAARNNHSKVTMADFEYARDKVLMGARREEVLLGVEKEKTAYHEAGHALIAWLASGAERVHKVTVIPRGRALGVTQILPQEDRMNISETELNDRLAFIMGGRAAEKLVYGELSVGAQNDLEQSTKLARRMVTQWGMSERLGPVNYKTSGEDPFLGREFHEHREFSEHTMQVIDEEVARVLHGASDRAYELLTENRAKLDAIAQALVEREEIDDADIEALIGPPAYRKGAAAVKESLEHAQENGKAADKPKTPQA